jgi:hypothetical protein
MRKFPKLIDLLESNNLNESAHDDTASDDDISDEEFYRRQGVKLEKLKKYKEYIANKGLLPAPYKLREFLGGSEMGLSGTTFINPNTREILIDTDVDFAAAENEKEALNQLFYRLRRLGIKLGETTLLPDEVLPEDVEDIFSYSVDNLFIVRDGDGIDYSKFVNPKGFGNPKVVMDRPRQNRSLVLISSSQVNDKLANLSKIGTTRSVGFTPDIIYPSMFKQEEKDGMVGPDTDIRESLSRGSLYRRRYWGRY